MIIDTKKAAKLLTENDNIVILSHQNPDGDTLGCGFALFHALKSIGKNVRHECENAVPRKFEFLGKSVINDEFEPKFVVSVDVADINLLGERTRVKYEGKIDLSIDHHMSHRDFSDYTLTENRASACEIVFGVIKEAGIPVTKEIADCLYLGVSTDTGCFRYSNTNSNTHICAAELISLGADNALINRLMFETKTVTYAKLERLALDSLEMHFDGQVALMCVTKEMFDQSGSDETECDGISALPRQIEGVKAGVTIREKGENSYKISVRTNEPVDACEICARLGGGGHTRASGCTFNGTLEEAKATILNAVKESL